MSDGAICGDHHLKVPVIRRPGYTVLLEEHVTAGTFIHCDVLKWTPEVFRDLRETFPLLCQLHGGPIHALHDVCDRKHEKFLRLFGFERLCPCWEGHEIWIWRNNG
jgi:hypothetical protein